MAVKTAIDFKYVIPFSLINAWCLGTSKEKSIADFVGMEKQKIRIRLF